MVPSSFVAGARAGTVRCLIPVHVWEEVPRVLADRHHEGGRFDPGRALELWQSRYAPVLYVVDTAGLPMTPQAQVLAGRDASDVPMLLLAGVIAPVVIIGTDADLVDPHNDSQCHSGATGRLSGVTRYLGGPTRLALDNASMHIRAVRLKELPLLQDIERAAGRCFRDIGMPEIADDEPLPLGELARYQLAGLAWVAVNDVDIPVAYLIADRVDGNLHVEQVSVHPDSSRRGIGLSLLDHLADHATREGTPALTLTTFTEVPWNAPYYTRCGFQLLDDSRLALGLRQIREREAAHGLDRWPRGCMRRALGRGGAVAVPKRHSGGPDQMN